MTSTFGGCCDHRATPENHPGSCPRFSLVKGRCSGPDFWDWAKLLPQYFDLASYFFSVRNAHLQFDCSTTKQQLWFRLHARVEANSGFTYAKIHKYNLPGDGTWIYEFCLTEQKHGVWIAVVPESVTSTAELVELNRLPNLISKFDWGAVLLPFVCRTIPD